MCYIKVLAWFIFFKLAKVRISQLHFDNFKSFLKITVIIIAEYSLPYCTAWWAWLVSPLRHVTMLSHDAVVHVHKSSCTYTAEYPSMKPQQCIQERSSNSVNLIKLVLIDIDTNVGAHNIDIWIDPNTTSSGRGRWAHKMRLEWTSRLCFLILHFVFSGET